MKLTKYRYLSLVLTLLTLLPCISVHADGSDATSLLRTASYQELDRRYGAIQQQFVDGKITGDQLRDQFRGFYPTDRDLAARYDAWVTASPNSYVARLARGIYYKRVGLEERGERYISETSTEQIDRMNSAFSLASRDLGASIGLNPKPFLSYLHTMDIGRQYISNEQLRLLFDHAAALDPDSFGLRIKFMVALQPRWGGSVAAMQAFLEECKKTRLAVGDLNQLEAMVLGEEGNAERTAGNLKGAEIAYRKAVALGPCPCTNVRGDLNNLLFQTQQYSAAIVLLDQYLTEDPNDLWALANRGAAKVLADRPEEGVSDLEKAAKAGDGFSQKQLASVYLIGAGKVKADYELSVYWFSQAVLQGEPGAQIGLRQAQQLAEQTKRLQLP